MHSTGLSNARLNHTLASANLSQDWLACLNVILRQGLTLASCYLRPDADPIDPNAKPFVLPGIITIELRCRGFLNARIFDRCVKTPNSLRRVIE